MPLQSSRRPTFFDLPVELRYQIYKLVLGGDVLFIQLAAEGGRAPVARPDIILLPTHRRRFEGAIWRELDPECAAISPAGPFQRKILPDWFHMGLPYPEPALPDWRPLLTCRRMYAEARLVPFAHNTFAFDALRTMTGFFGVLAEDKRNALRSIRLDMRVHGGREEDHVWHWHRNDLLQALPLLSRISSLDICIFHECGYGQVRRRAGRRRNPYSMLAVREEWLVLFLLKRLDLRHMKIAFWTEDFQDFYRDVGDFDFRVKPDVKPLLVLGPFKGVAQCQDGFEELERRLIGGLGTMLGWIVASRLQSGYDIQLQDGQSSNLV